MARTDELRKEASNERPKSRKTHRPTAVALAVDPFHAGTVPSVKPDGCGQVECGLRGSASLGETRCHCTVHKPAYSSGRGEQCADWRQRKGTIPPHPARRRH